MTLCLILLGLVCWMLAPSEAQGMFIQSETRTVPISRLFANLQQRQAKNTNDFAVTHQLARLHSMAYATNLEAVEVRVDDDTTLVFDYPWLDSSVPKTISPINSLDAQRAGLCHLTNAILLYERAILLLRKSTNVSEQRWMILPTQLGLAWCLDQAGRRTEAIQAYRKALQVSWKMEVTGDFKLEDWLKDVWNDVRSGRNPIHEQRRGGIGPGVCYSQEIIGYLLRILDPVKDAKEIAQLQKDRQTLTTMPRWFTPILISLQAGSEFDDLVNTNARVAFDLDGTGLRTKWGWITPKAAWLVYDTEAKGQITSGLQMFGNVTFWIFWRDGYEALSALDDNGDGVLSGSELRGLALWHDLNSNGVSDPGEVIPVQEFGITTIDCSSQQHVSGLRWNPVGVKLKDGSTRATFDWIAPSSAGQPAQDGTAGRSD